MATQAGTVDYILEQLASLSHVSARKMFGEYGLYVEGKIVALICDDQLFLKPTEPGRAFAPDATEAPPFHGAKPSLLIDGGRWDDAEWLCELIRVTADALPAPKPKGRKTGR
jgi:TfoX/Sxy family transcriptional regulator of competence genes